MHSRAGCRELQGFAASNSSLDFEATKDHAGSSCCQTFPKTDDTTCHRWAGAICEAIQFVRVKSQKLTSGKKQTPAVMEVAKVYLQQSRRSGYTLKNAGHFAQGSSKKRKLQREHSSPKKSWRGKCPLLLLILLLSL